MLAVFSTAFAPCRVAAAAPADAPAVVGSLAPAPIEQFVGAWEGVYLSYPHPMGLKVSLTRSDAASVEGEVHFHPLRSARTAMRAPEGRFRVRGTYDPELRTFTLTPGEWIERPRQGGRPFRLEGVFAASQPALAGVLGGQRSDAPHFTLVRPDHAADLTRRAMLTPARSRGGRTPNDEQLIRWAARLVDEYPDIDPRRTQMGRLFTLAANLFEDEFFRAHFGKTFDQMNARERAAVRERFARTSRISTRRPGTLGALLERRPNEDLRRFNALERAFHDTGSPSGLTLVQMVLAQRVIRAWAADHVAHLGELAPAAESFQALDRLVAAAESRLSGLWPSEQARFREDVDRARTTLYAAATQELERYRQRAATTLREAAERDDDHRAQYLLGLTHVDPGFVLPPELRALNRTLTASGRGLRVTQDDHRQAAAWFRRAAEQGYAPAQNDLGLLYSAGRGVARDDRQAAAWYRAAAEQGHLFAQHNLAFSYAAGRGIPADATQAVRWYTRSAREGYAPSQYELGRAYEAGRGVARSYERAAEWYRRAAEQGHPHAQNDLGVLYSEGRGVARNEANARMWFRRAADGGSAQGLANLQRAQSAARAAQQQPGLLEALAGLFVLGLIVAAASGPGDADAAPGYDPWAAMAAEGERRQRELQAQRDLLEATLPWATGW